MIEKWFEPFLLLERKDSSDGMGGRIPAFTDALTFQGVLTYTAGQEVGAAGQQLLAEQPALLHEFDVTLSPGDHIRRVKDGAVYRVAGRSDAQKAPAFSGLRFAQVPVERVVRPC